MSGARLERYGYGSACMGDVIFACDKNNYQVRQSQFRGPRQREYYEGEYLISSGDEVDVRIEKGLECTFPILNLRTRTDTIFRRSWTHIQRDRTDVIVIWFVKRGRVIVTDNRGTNFVNPGECAITRSLQPFHMQNLVDDESINEVLHVIVPTHVLRSYIPDAVRSGAAFSFQCGDCRAAERIFTMLYEEGTRVDRHVAEEMMRAAFAALGHRMSMSGDFRPAPTLRERRLHDILSCIEMHLSNPDLAPADVARRCGISIRYLFSILKAQGTSFMEVLWNRRVEKAKSWLTENSMSHLPIAKIGFMAGFRSPATFSRVFRRSTMSSPQEYRETHSAPSDSADHRQRPPTSP
jgi:AraC-like DNA-binding protein